MNINTKGMREGREGESEKERESQGIEEKKLLQKMNPSGLISCERNDVMNFSM